MNRLITLLPYAVALYFINTEAWKAIKGVIRISAQLRQLQFIENLRRKVYGRWIAAHQSEDWAECEKLQREYGRLCCKYEKELDGSFTAK